jgi:hypothetical protein
MLPASVSIATGYRLDGRCKRFFSTTSRMTQGLTLPPIQRIPEALSLGANWPGREADQSPSSTAEVKNGRAIIPFPLTSSWSGDN